MSSQGSCSLGNKLDGNRELCTYENPTNQIPTDTYTKNYSLTIKNIPMVAHVHGLEVRPTFDGNPTSWIGQQGALGLGFQSLSDTEYYTSSGFKNKLTTKLKPVPNLSFPYAKVNRYENVQPPGNLWYHDHAMDLTANNVFNGLAGNYIIYDKETEKGLPSNKNNIIIIAGQYMISNTVIGEAVGANGMRGMRVNPKDTPFNSKTDLQRNQTYRIKLLNAQYDSTFTGLRFLTECDEKTLKIGSISNCSKILTFSVIGSDSSLFHEPVHGVRSIDVASAERFEMLIVFDGSSNGVAENPISSTANNVVLISGNFNSSDDSNGNGPVRQKFNLEKVRSDNDFKKLPSQV